MLSPDLIDALEQLVIERIDDELARTGVLKDEGLRWLTIAQAAARLSCSPAAVRMRVKRGRLVARHHGRRVYVCAASVDNLA